MSSILGALSAVFWGVLLLSILVFVHEGGHYLAARAFGVRVTEFFLGLPCPIKISHKSKSRGTEFGVTVFLLGGYNRICGMEGTQDDLMAQAFAIVQREGRVSAQAVADELGIDLDRSYAILVSLSDYASIRPYYDPELGEKPSQSDYPEAFETLERDAAMLTEYDKGHDFDQPGTTQAGEPRPVNDAEAQLEAERSHTYEGLPYLKRLVVLFAGPLVNVVLALLIVTGVYLGTEYAIPLNKNTIGTVVEDSLAQEAGLEAGDTVTSIAGRNVTDWQTLVAAIDEACAAGEDFDVTYERDGVQGTARIELPEGEATDKIGVVAPTEPYRLSLPEAFMGSLSYAGTVVSYVVKLIIPTHTMEVLDQSSSIVGISVMASQAASAGFMSVISLLAAISMSLGFMNLLPIPPLDGGKILVETIQAVMRRRLSMKVQTWLSYAGLAFFIFVFVFVLRNDVLRFVIQ